LCQAKIFNRSEYIHKVPVMRAIQYAGAISETPAAFKTSKADCKRKPTSENHEKH